MRFFRALQWACVAVGLTALAVMLMAAIASGADALVRQFGIGPVLLVGLFVFVAFTGAVLGWRND